MFAPLHHVPTGGPWSFGETRSVFVATPAGAMRSTVDEGDHAQAGQALLVRYLEAFGPATAGDFGQFSILRRPVVNAAVDALGDVLPAVLVDGHVRGVWRVVDDAVEVSAFERLTDEQWSMLADEATALVAFLADRDPNVYRRYHHWWAKGIAAAQVVTLSG